MSIRVMIADDHELIRQGLRMYLSADPAIQVVGEAADGAAAVRLAHELQPDVVVMDLLLPRMGGLEAIASIHRETPCIRVIALTAADDGHLVLDAMRAGAVGYFLKSVGAAGLCRAIHTAAAGRASYSSEAMIALERAVTLPGGHRLLTARELAVLQLAAAGLTNKVIAQALCLGERTVKNHMTRIKAKLGYASRTQAVLFAVRAGLTAQNRQEPVGSH